MAEKRIRIEKHVTTGGPGQKRRIVVVAKGSGPNVVVSRSGDDIEVEEIEVDELLKEHGFEWEDDDGTTVLKIKVPKHTREDGEDDALVRAAGVSGAIENLEGEIGALVRRAREQGYSWTAIGNALGTSKQAAWERFSGEE